MPLNGAFNIQSILPDPIMSNIAIARIHGGEFIADRLMPVVGVQADYGRYAIFGSEAITQVVDTKRAPGASAALGTMSRTYDTFMATEDAHKEELHEEDFQGMNPATVREQAIDVDLMQIKIAIESRVQAMVAAISNTMAVSTKWDQANPTIMKNWLDAREAFRKQYGIYPNLCEISPTIANIMSVDADIKDYVKYTKPDLLEAGILPPRIRGVELVIPTANIKTSLAATALTDIWDNGEKSITFLYVQPGATYNPATNTSNITATMTNTWGLQIRSTSTGGLTVATRNWMDPDQSKKTEYVSCDLKQVEKQVNGKLGMRVQVLT